MQPTLKISAHDITTLHLLIAEVKLHFGVDWTRRFVEFYDKLKSAPIFFNYSPEILVNEKGITYNCVLILEYEKRYYQFVKITHDDKQQQRTAV